MSQSQSLPTAKQPFVRIARRGSIPRQQAWLIRAGGLLAALTAGALLILSLGHNPIAVYADMLNSAFGDRTGFNQLVRIAVPL